MSHAATDTFAPGLDSLAARMLDSQHNAGASFVVSPACLALALEVLARGATGETLTQIDAALGGQSTRTKALAAILDAGSSDVEAVAGVEPDEAYSYTVGTSVWADVLQAPVKDSFTEAIESLNGKPFPARFGTQQTKEAMSAWLRDNTDGKFATAPELSANTVLAIVSALHFRDAWHDSFVESENTTFHGTKGDSDVPMMDGLSDYSALLDDPRGTAVSWPMRSGARMVFCMPKDSDSLDAFVRNGDAWDLTLRCQRNQGTSHPSGGINLHVPEFDLKADGTELSQFLRNIGIQRAFLPGAEFGNMTDADIMVDSCMQSAKLKIDTDGAEGGAFTIMCCVTGAALFDCEPPVEVTFDRPFAFALFNRSGAPLFVGTYMGE